MDFKPCWRKVCFLSKKLQGGVYKVQKGSRYKVQKGALYKVHWSISKNLRYIGQKWLYLITAPPCSLFCVGKCVGGKQNQTPRTSKSALGVATVRLGVGDC